MFKKLRNLFAQAPAPTGHALNLTQPQMEMLRRLASSADFRGFQDLLDARLMLQSEKLLAASDPFRLAQLQGTLLGIRIAGSLVDEALQHEEHDLAQRSRTDRHAANTAERRAIALKSGTFGTPAWPAAKS